MPYADPERQRQYLTARQERRKTDPVYIAKRKASFKHRYDNDPEFRARYKAYQSAYRKARRRSDPEWRAKESREGTRSGRRARGMVWTPEEEAAHLTLTCCEVCGRTPKRGLDMDHCHDCGAYRGGLCSTCNQNEGVLRKWRATLPEGSPMRVYLERHVCQ